MRPILAAALTLLAAGTVATPVGAAPLQGDQEIAALNGQRAMNGIPGDVFEDVGWSNACAKHMAYLKLNNTLAHEEIVGAPGYTAEGAAAGSKAVLSSGGAAFEADGSNQFQQAPIHLMQMLNPFMVGSGAADGCLITQWNNSRTFPTNTTFSFPGDGGVGLASETAYEGPFVPGDFVGLPMGTKTGQHLYFYAAKAGGSWYDSLGQITSASLTRNGQGGGPVAVKTVDNTTKGTSGSVNGQNLGQYLSPGGIVIPVAPLTVGASYTATVNFKFTKDNSTIARTWSFTAAAKLPLPTVPATTRPPVTTPTPVPSVTPTTPTPTPTSTPAPASTPTPTPTPGAGPSFGNGIDPSPVGLTKAKLTKHTLSVIGSREAPIWATIEQKKVSGKGKTAKTKFTFREALSITVKANVAVTVTHKRLSKGEYRMTFRRGGAKGVIELQKTVKLR